MRLPSTEIKLGHLVIMNHFDRPSCRLMARVDYVAPYRVSATYLCEGVNSQTCCARPEDVTPVNDFGYVVDFDGTSITAHAQTFEHPTKACYSDGKPRHWQPEDEEPESYLVKNGLRESLAAKWKTEIGENTCQNQK